MKNYQSLINDVKLAKEQCRYQDAREQLEGLLADLELPQSYRSVCITHITDVYKSLQNSDLQKKWLIIGVSEFPDEVHKLKLLADFYFNCKSYQECIVEVDKIILLRSDNKWDYLQRGHCYRFLQQFEKAERDYKKVHELDSLFFNAYVAYAQVANEMNQQDVFVERCKILLDKFPKEIQSHTNLAYAYILCNDYSLAIATYVNALHHHPANPVIHYALGNAYTHEGKEAMAMQHYLQAISKLEQPKQLVHIGTRALSYKRFSDTEKILERLQEINPTSKEFFLLLSRYLESKLNFVEGLHRLEEALKHHPQDVGLRIRKTKFLQAVFRHREANVILDKLLEEHTDNIEIKLLNAKRYELEHKFPVALGIYNDLKPNLTPYPYLFFINCLHISGDYDTADKELENYINEKGYLPNNYYYALYVKNAQYKNTHKLNEVYDTLLREDIPASLLTNYITALQKKEDIDKVKRFVKTFAQRRDVNIHSKIVAQLEISRLENIEIVSQDQNVDYGELTASSVNQSLEKIEAIINDAQNIVAQEWYTINKKALQDIDDTFKGCYLYTKENPVNAFRVADTIIKHIRSKQPFSLVRLGDGEGNYFPYPEEFRKYNDSDQDMIQRIWWGQPLLSDQKDIVVERFLQATRNADVIGVLDMSRLLTNFDIRSKKVEYPYVRAARGVHLINRLLPQLMQTSAKDKMITSCFVHQDFHIWNLYAYIFEHVDACSVITCHTRARGYLKEHFNLDLISEHIIPSEYRWKNLMKLETSQTHYPNFYQDLRNNIQVTYPGELYLVAAGFLGKEYCDIIKQRGGIAIDVGSIFDYWFNFETRASFQLPVHELDFGKMEKAMGDR